MMHSRLQAAFSGVVEFIMGSVESKLGNRGEYDKSDMYSDLIIRGCLRFRRLGALHINLYNRWWNYAERKRRDIPTDMVLDDEEELNKCILFSQLCRYKTDENFYRRKLALVLADKAAITSRN